MTICVRVGRICSAAGILFFLLAPFVCSAVVAAEPKRVMMLYSFGRDFRPWSDYARIVRAELNRLSPWPLDVFEHSLVVSDRSQDGELESAFIEYLRVVFAKRPLDLIVAIGAPAGDFVQRHRREFFATTPMVLTGIEHRRVQYSDITKNDALVASRIDYFPAFENFLRILPGTKNISVIIGDSPIEKYSREIVAKEVEPLADRIAITFTDHLSFEDILKHSAALPPQSALAWVVMVVDGAGVVHDGVMPFTQLHAVANAPIFSFDDAFFGSGIVGGPLVSTFEASQKTAAVAVRILGGEKPGDIKVPAIEAGTPEFDWREMQRWAIIESRLPAGSQIFFRDPTAWEQYRDQILGVSAAIIIQAALIGWLLRERQHRRSAERDARKTMAELTLMNRLATAGELSASIAHEVKQPVAAIAMQASAALRWLRAGKPNLERAGASLEEIVAASHRADDIVTSIRAMFKKDTKARQPIDIGALIRTVLSIVQIDLQRNDVMLNAQLDEQLPMVNGDKVQLQQVVLNLIMNAIEAMQSVQIRALKLRTDQSKPGIVRVSIEDTGPGIDPSNIDRIFKPMFTTKASGTGMGLAICHSIIQSHDGRIWVTPGVTGGSIFQFELPANSEKDYARHTAEMVQEH